VDLVANRYVKPCDLSIRPRRQQAFLSHGGAGGEAANPPLAMTPRGPHQYSEERARRLLQLLQPLACHSPVRCIFTKWEKTATGGGRAALPGSRKLVIPRSGRREAPSLGRLVGRWRQGWPGGGPQSPSQGAGRRAKGPAPLSTIITGRLQVTTLVSN
jgi:hypothetical protein